MAVPGFQEMFLPYLQCLADGKPRHNSEIREYIEKALQISKADLEEMVPSGQSTKVANRVGWARTHLSKAGLTAQVTRGVYRISDEGKKIITAPPLKIDLKFLDTIPRHKDWFHTPKKAVDDKEMADERQDEPPNERIEEAFEELNAALAGDLLDNMFAMNPYKFEKLVVDLLFSMGYGGSRSEAAQVTKKSNDEGIDGIINEDRLGLDVIYIQAKRYQKETIIGRKEIQSFVGALAGKQANKGVFITTSGFNKNAIDYAESISQKVILIDGARLAALMIEYNIGVSTDRTVEIKRLDSDYFED
jgi:restriction system protein